MFLPRLNKTQDLNRGLRAWESLLCLSSKKGVHLQCTNAPSVIRIDNIGPIFPWFSPYNSLIISFHKYNSMIFHMFQPFFLSFFQQSLSCSLHTGPKASLDTASSTGGTDCGAGGSGELAGSWFVGIHSMNSVPIFDDESCGCSVTRYPVPSSVILRLGILILAESLWGSWKRGKNSVALLKKKLQKLDKDAVKEKSLSGKGEALKKWRINIGWFNR